jgi:hypothetical protein
MQRLFVALHGTLGSYLRDALQEGGGDVDARFSLSPYSLDAACLIRNGFSWTWSLRGGRIACWWFQNL